MPSITTWTRLEPRPRAPALAPTLSARVRDPLWMLTRQWQVGEFRGEDAGSPAWAQLAATTSRFMGWQVEGETTVRPLPASDPIEDTVESEPFTPDLTLRVELGQVFERLLAASSVAAPVWEAIQDAYPLPPLPPRPDDPPATPFLTLPLNERATLNAGTLATSLITAFGDGGIVLSKAATIDVRKTDEWWVIDDPDFGRRYAVRWQPPDTEVSVFLDPPAELEADRAAERFRAVCAGRAIDGFAIYCAVKAKQPLLPAARSGGAAGTNRLLDAGQGLLAWVAGVYGDVGAADAPAWEPERLEYRLSAIAATPDGGLATLAVHPGHTGAFDWYALDLRAHSRGTNPTQTMRFSMLPGHVRFRGMPNARWWEFETGTAPFGEIRPDRRDVAKLVLIDFALVHGNDWFMLPIEQPVGSLCRVDSLVVHDVFGVETLIERADAAPARSGELWTLFSTAVEDESEQVADFFLLPPSAAGATQVGAASEDVRFLRDEAANVAWAVEEATENGVGEPWSGHERDQARRAQHGDRPPATTSGPTPPPLRYLLQTPVPESWIPFLPVGVDPQKGIFRLERVFAQRTYGPDGPILPVGRILRPTKIGPGEPYRIFEEEVPREGMRVTRHAVRSRWIDGSTHLWIARRKNVGTGEGSAGLRFDLAVPAGRSPDDI